MIALIFAALFYSAYQSERQTERTQDEQKSNEDECISHFLMGVALEDKELREHASLCSMVALIREQNITRSRLLRAISMIND